MEHSTVPMSEAKGAMGKKQLRKDWQRDARKYPSIFPFNLFSFHFYLLCFILFFFLLLTDNARKRWQKKNAFSPFDIHNGGTQKNTRLNSKLPFQWKTKSNEKGEVIPVGNHIRMIMTTAVHSRVSSHSGRYFWGEDLSEQLKSAMKELKVVCFVVCSSNDAFRSSAKEKCLPTNHRYQF